MQKVVLQAGVRVMRVISAFARIFDCISTWQELHIASTVKNETWMHKQEKKN